MTERAVVIAGGGPKGLMLARELALAGIDVGIVERRASLPITSAPRLDPTVFRQHVAQMLVGDV
jgi:2-polyprenyl-6-methoxyphenol hydroxylase-like FAD-dependent oxidoreductase